MSIQIADVIGVWRLRAAVAGCVAFAVGLALTSMVHADSPPLGKCYGGALSSEPLHCYILEQAKADEVLEVEAVYEAGGSVYVYISQKGNMTEEITGYLREKTGEFYDRWPAYAPDGPRYARCRGVGNSHRECLVDEQHWSGEVDFVFLPWPAGYTAVGVFTGGADARKSRRGWPSWSQLWPVVEESDGKPGDLVGKFDVSELDLNTEREVDCFLWHTPTFCSTWKKRPGSSVAGWYFDHDGGKVYLQAKQPPEDQEQFNFIKTAILTPGTADFEVVVVPVKYDYGELWRWAEILHRFAATSGNTIGIITARVSVNEISGHREVVWPLDDLRPPSSHLSDYDKLRQTVRIHANDAERVAAALPVLLPQLGIPVDAVGMVVLSDWERNMTGRVITDVGRELPVGNMPTGAGVEMESGPGVGGVAIGVAGLVAAVVVFGVVVLVGMRLRRRA